MNKNVVTNGMIAYSTCLFEKKDLRGSRTVSEDPNTQGSLPYLEREY